MSKSEYVKPPASPVSSILSLSCSQIDNAMIALDYETLALHNDLSDDDKNLPPMIFRGNFLDVDERKDAIDAISEYMTSFEDDES